MPYKEALQLRDTRIRRLNKEYKEHGATSNDVDMLEEALGR